jgi:branched-chain amino acid aminotransferase
MLDPNGFVASCNSTNFFIVRGEEPWTSTGRYNFNGITRASVIELYRTRGGVVREIDFTLAEVYGADEAFATGTLGGVTPVTRVDGRVIGVGRPGVVTRRIGDWYQEAIAKV